MRAGLFKLICEQFASAIVKSYPSFKLTKKDQRWWEWRNELASDLHCIIALQAMERDDIFTVEIAWSDENAFPYRAPNKLSLDNVKGRRRLGSIWRDAIEPGWSGTSPNWDLVPEMTVAVDEHIRALAQGQNTPLPKPPPIDAAKTRIPPLVDDALAKIDKYAIPMFREVARVREIEWKA